MSALPRRLFVRNPDVVLREEDEDGGLLFNPDTNQVKILNVTGLFLWKQCDGTHSLEDMLSLVRAEFDGAPTADLEPQVLHYLEGLQRASFLGEAVERP